MPSEVQFLQLPPDTIEPLWHLILPRVKSGVDRSSGRLTIEYVQAVLMRGDWQCWTAWEAKNCIAAVITRIRPDPSGMKVLDAIIATGDDRGKWQRLAADRLEAFAKDEGCGLFEMWARPGWERVFPDFKKTHVLLEKRIQ